MTRTFSWLPPLPREPLAIPMLLCLINGLFGKIIDNISASNLKSALLSTFEISIIVWVAIWIGVTMLWRSEKRALTVPDVVVGALGVVAAMLPWGVMGWVGLAGVAFRLIVIAPAQSFTCRSGWVLFAVTVPMVWSKILFAMFAPFILAFDATLVSSVLQTSRDGNIVAVPGGSGFLKIAAACSSLANTSLVVPLWMSMTQAAGLPFRARRLQWPFLAGVTEITINVLRISLIGFFPEQYDLIHGQYGQLIVGLLIMGAIYLVCQKGLEYEKAAALEPNAGRSGGLPIA